MEDLDKVCQKYGKPNGYKELDRKDRLVIQCDFVGGASGSPGIVIYNNIAYVVFVYIRGFPSFYYSQHFLEKDKRIFPREKLFQQGVNIGDLFDTMSRNTVHFQLCNEIFPEETKFKLNNTVLDASFDLGYWRQKRASDTAPITVAISKEEFDSKYYKIETGILLVISNTEFHVHDANLGDLAGSHIDASRISQRFSELGFEYEIETNLSKSDTMDWFERAKRRLSFKAVDCFVLVILSLRTDNGVYATDKLIRTEDIVEAFNATHCPPLRFKPKTLITQSCRGTHLSGGINVDVFDPNRDDDSRYPSEYPEWIGIPITKTIRLPNEADFLFVYAAVSGSGAFRNAAESTPFIRHLSKAIKDMEVNEDFYRVLHKVHTTMGVTYNRYGEAEYNNQVQMPSFVSHLTKLLRLRQAK